MSKRRPLQIAIALLVLGLAAISWILVVDIRTLRTMCDEIEPGMPIADVRETIQFYGFRDITANNTPPGIRFRDNTFFWFIRSWLPINPITCDIDHDGNQVTGVDTLGIHKSLSPPHFFTP